MEICGYSSFNDNCRFSKDYKLLLLADSVFNVCSVIPCKDLYTTNMQKSLKIMF